MSLFSKYLKNTRKKDVEILKNIGINNVRRNNPNEENNSFFTFYDLFCFKEVMTNKTKRKFFKLASKIIDSKLSLEYQMRYYSNMEKLKLISLNNEQLDFFNNIPNFKIEKHLDEIRK